MSHAAREQQKAKDISQVWLGTALAYFLAAAAMIHLTSNGRDIAPVWPANAILVAMLLSYEKPHWRTILSAGFVGNLAANIVTRGTWTGPILYGAANLVEVVIAAKLLRNSFQQDSILASPSTVIRFILVAGLLAPTASGILGSVTAAAVYGEPFAKSLVTWIGADGLGLLVFTPFLFAVLKGDYVDCFNRKTWRERTETFAVLVLIGGVAGYVFFISSRPMLFIIFPPLMLITFRDGRLGTKAGVMLVAAIGGSATMSGHGPITLLTPDLVTQAQFFQVFLLTILLTCLPAAAEVTSRDRRSQALADHDQQMTIAAFRDPLTGALNRAGLEAEAELLLNRSVTTTSIIAIDFDHFKQINDQWGHQAGDKALKHLTSVLQANVRNEDIVARTGGDEFLVLLPTSDLHLATYVAERIQLDVRTTPLRVDDTSIALISLSMGVASSQVGEPLRDLLKRADAALYDAKRAGRDTLRAAG